MIVKFVYCTVECNLMNLVLTPCRNQDYAVVNTVRTFGSYKKRQISYVADLLIVV